MTQSSLLFSSLRGVLFYKDFQQLGVEPTAPLSFGFRASDLGYWEMCGAPASLPAPHPRPARDRGTAVAVLAVTYLAHMPRVGCPLRPGSSCQRASSSVRGRACRLPGGLGPVEAQAAHG